MYIQDIIHTMYNIYLCACTKKIRNKGKDIT